MNKVRITNYTSDTTDTTDVHICVQNDALLMHEAVELVYTKAGIFRSQGARCEVYM